MTTPKRRTKSEPGDVTPRKSYARMSRTGRGAAPGHRERVALRQAAALKLRLCGASYRAIGEQLGVSAMQAHRDVAVALAETVAQRNEDATALRTLELERLDRLSLALWSRAQNADIEAVRALVKISETRARLLGLNAETQARLTVAGHTTSVAAVVTADRPFAAMNDAEVELRFRQLSDLLLAERQPSPAIVGASEPTDIPETTAEAEYARVLAARRNGAHQ